MAKKVMVGKNNINYLHEKDVAQNKVKKHSLNVSIRGIIKLFILNYNFTQFEVMFLHMHLY